MRRCIGFMAGVVALVSGHLSDAHERPTRADLMADAAKVFIENLTEEQKAIALRRLDDERARTSWHYLPEDSTTRSGITLAQLTPDQRKAVHAMLVAALSSQGYGKLPTSCGSKKLFARVRGPP